MNTDPRSTIMFMRSCKPITTIDDIKKVLRQRYGIQACVVKEYESYDDRTYYVKTAPGYGIGKRSEFIAKVLNSQFTAPEGVAAAQSDVLNHLKSFPELCCQFILPNLDGNLLSYEMILNDLRDGDVYIGRQKALSVVRLFNFLPGKVLHDASPLPPTFFFDAGKHLGKLQQALQEYAGDTAPLKLKTTESMWCLSCVPQLRGYLPLVTDTQKRQLVEEVIDQFEITVLPVMGELRKGIVYHDYNGHNVLLTISPDNDVAAINGDSNHANDQNSTGVDRIKHQISGIIDFDDVMYTCLVYEIATGMMYMMFCCDQPVEATANMLTGFESVSPLPHNERRLLKVLVASRFAQSLLTSLLQTKNHPDNAYVGSSLVKGWTLLESWWNQTESQLNLCN